jgi:nitroreductase
MEAMEAILSRRSIRTYTTETVSDELVTEILKAAMSAPTAASQPYHFVVIRDRSILKAVTAFHPHAHMLEQASVAIAVVGDPTIETLKGRWLLDCAAATENMLIAANALGLGGCWVGIYPVEDRIRLLRELLKMPDHVVPFSMISVGYPAERKRPSDRFRQDKIHHDIW